MHKGSKERLLALGPWYPGRKTTLTAKRICPGNGKVIADPSGHIAFFLVGKDRPTRSPSIQTPVGSLVAYYGAFTVDDANNKLTYKIEDAASPLA